MIHNLLVLANLMSKYRRDPVTVTVAKTKTTYYPLWEVTIAGFPRCPVWSRLVTVPTDPLTTFTSPTGPFLSEWAKCQPGNIQDGETYFRSRIWWQMLNVEAKFVFEFLSNDMFISLSFGDIRMWLTDRRTDNTDHYYSWPHIVAGKLKTS